MNGKADYLKNNYFFSNKPVIKFSAFNHKYRIKNNNNTKIIPRL